MFSGLSGSTILVADDERSIARTISLKLRQAGASVLTASDGQQALELAMENLPNLVCTDYRMSPMSGVEFARELRSTPETAHIPVVLLNSHVHRVSPNELVDTNIRALLPKPFSIRELLGKLQELAIEAGVAI